MSKRPKRQIDTTSKSAYNSQVAGGEIPPYLRIVPDRALADAEEQQRRAATAWGARWGRTHDPVYGEGIAYVVGPQGTRVDYYPEVPTVIVRSETLFFQSREPVTTTVLEHAIVYTASAETEQTTLTVFREGTVQLSSQPLERGLPNTGV